MKNIINERDMEVGAFMIVICHTLDCLINKDCCSLSKKRQHSKGLTNLAIKFSLACRKSIPASLSDQTD